MSRREVTNIPASVRARLLGRAKEQGESFDQLLVYFAIERFLYRLSQTEWGDRLVVKGATMLRAWGTPLGRPTRDIDFLGSIDSSPAAVAAVVKECLSVAYPADGLVFDEAVETAEINVEDRYPGVRVIVGGHLDGARFRVGLDIGIDDAVVPDAEWVDYPTILDFDPPRILAYVPPTAVAEKLHAMVTHGVANSRMKDFYDVWLLSRVHEFDGVDLVSAVRATFAHRGTDLTGQAPVTLTGEFYGDQGAQSRWAGFRSKTGVDAPADLGIVCEAIAAFIMPVVAAAAGGRALRKRWKPGEGWR